ncbi:hypothetical protein OS493_021941 [Desmophyllum pertusum]|uniref:Uncharacterized protein n=1 Tax=Desmophyllum pertusum TaxID=174260 RepID=A0A9W9ZEE2_9CNID|nr:hypothetical protein OS493_021941 [Desmophyllum pertusum]
MKLNWKFQGDGVGYLKPNNILFVGGGGGMDIFCNTNYSFTLIAIFCMHVFSAAIIASQHGKCTQIKNMKKTFSNEGLVDERNVTCVCSVIFHPERIQYVL